MASISSIPSLPRLTIRRTVFVALCVSAVGGGGVAAFVAPSATASQDPCAASSIARTVGSVATSTGNYLDMHPETNQALTTISQQQAGPQSLAALKTYFDANPKVAADMQQLQLPLASLSGRCNLPVTLPQLMGLLQAAQQSGAAQTPGLPAGLPTAQTVGVPAAAVPTQPSPVSSTVQGSGPIPSSVVAGVR